MLRQSITAALNDAVKQGHEVRKSTLRLILTAIKDKEIQNRGDDDAGDLTDEKIVDLLGRMVKQRKESILAYENGGREDLVAREREEIEVIQQFLPTPLTEGETAAAIRAAISETGANGIRDMGRVMTALKQAHPGRLDVARASAAVKAALA